MSFLYESHCIYIIITNNYIYCASLCLFRGVSVALSTTITLEECKFILDDCGATIVVVGQRHLLEKIKKVNANGKKTQLLGDSFHTYHHFVALCL